LPGVFGGFIPVFIPVFFPDLVASTLGLLALALISSVGLSGFAGRLAARPPTPTTATAATTATEVMGLVVAIILAVVLAAALATRTFFADQDLGWPAAQKAHETRLGLFENLDFDFVPARSKLEQGLGHGSLNGLA
jgi:hypothetical protein